MLDSATLIVTGNVVADPRVVGDVDSPDRVQLRVVANHRRRDTRTGEWVEAGEYGVNVVCWGRLARGVARSVHKGDPVRITGRLSERTYTDKDQVRRWHTEVTADFVGLDLSQGVVTGFSRFSRLSGMPAAKEPGVGGPGTGSEDEPDFGVDAGDVFERRAPELQEA